MRISQLEMHRVGVFEDETIEFRPKTDPDKAEIHILTGVNGSGKSTLLYALAAAFTGRRSQGFVQKRFYDIENSKASMTILNSVDTSYSVAIGYTQSNQFGWVTHPALINEYWQKLYADLQAIQNQEISFAVFAYSGYRTISSVSIGAIQELTNNPLSGSLDFQSSIDPHLLIQWIANTKAKIAFAQQDEKPDLAVRYGESIKRIEKAIQNIVGYPVEFAFSYEPLSVRVKVKSQELDFDVLPDGLKSIISWISDLLMRLDRLKWVDNTPVLDRNFILFLDEIEIHLHPAWQRRILPVVQKLFKNAQIFIATHSPFVVASVSDAWVYKFVVKDGKSKLESVEESKAGTSYPAVLDEIFGIDEYFDVETEKELDSFEKLKQKLLAGDKSVLAELRELVLHLAQTNSVEVQDIIGRELRQLQRITGETLEL